MSKIFTVDPSPIAALAAYSPAVFAPKMTTSVGVTPVIPPSITPLPPCKLLRYSDAIRTEVIPAISLIDSTTGIFPLLSLIFSNAIAVTFFLISFQRVSSLSLRTFRYDKIT